MTYCQTKYCHRFINFEIQAEIESQFQHAISQYVQSMRRLEGNALMLTKLQELSSETMASIRAQSGAETVDEDSGYKAFSLVMVVNPSCYEQACADFKHEQELNSSKRISLQNVQSSPDGGYVAQPIRATTAQQQPVTSQNVIGKVVFYKDYDTVSHPVEKLMGQWAADFHD